MTVATFAVLAYAMSAKPSKRSSSGVHVNKKICMQHNLGGQGAIHSASTNHVTVMTSLCFAQHVHNMFLGISPLSEMKLSQLLTKKEEPANPVIRIGMHLVSLKGLEKLSDTFMTLSIELQSIRS